MWTWTSWVACGWRSSSSSWPTVRRSQAIAVRQGEFCAHPLCHRLMGYTDEEILAERDKPGFSAPAMVRVSMGMYNTEAEIDTLIEAVRTIAGV